MFLLPLLLISLGARPTSDAPYPGAKEVFRCQFDESWDENYDAWPDGWTRRHGANFPHYISIEINDEPSPAGGRCLRVDLDGGAATAYSPPIPITSRCAYVLEGSIKTENLKHDRAYLSLILLDKQRQTVRMHGSELVQTTDGWKRFRVGPVAPDANVCSALIGLHVEPRGEAEDLQGAASFGDLWLGRLPRLTLAAPGGAGGFNVFADAR
jgi:hypothetical protein